VEVFLTEERTMVQFVEGAERVGAFIAVRFVRGLLFGVEATDIW
jgi:hypothetical protein